MQGTHNRDGVGSVHLDSKGQFKIVKYPRALTSILRHKQPFLTHMPHDGWTLVHLRAASHGKNAVENTHPFEVGDWCVAHNGIWSEYSIAALLLDHFAGVKCEGETDSEVAAHLLNIIGPEKFTEELHWAGVFMGLKRDGHLWVMKTSGELEAIDRNGQVLLSSEFDYRRYRRNQTYEVGCGYYHFGPDGKVLEKKKMGWKEPMKETSRGGGESAYHTHADDEELFEHAFAKPFIDADFEVGPSDDTPGEEWQESRRDLGEEDEARQAYLSRAMNLGIRQGPNLAPPPPYYGSGTVVKRKRGAKGKVYITPKQTSIARFTVVT